MILNLSNGPVFIIPVQFKISIIFINFNFLKFRLLIKKKCYLPAANAIFAAAMYQDLEPSSVKQFCGTARRFGFKGDIVIAVYDGTADRLQKEFKSSNAIIYNVAIPFTLFFPSSLLVFF